MAVGLRSGCGGTVHGVGGSEKCKSKCERGRRRGVVGRAVTREKWNVESRVECEKSGRIWKLESVASPRGA
eukprot:6747030-Prymnesium_polylepis.1